MINRIEIINFLSHKLSVLNLSPGVNVIIGPTDSGKSAVVRALRWLIFNRPSGESFRSNWGGDTTVSVELDKINTVVRGKGKTLDGYKLDKDEFKAVRSDVPEEVKQVLNLNEINLQTQFESHFLLSRSAGEVAAHLNKVAHLDQIDVGLLNTQRWLKSARQQNKSDEEEVKNFEDELSQYDDIDEIEKRVSDIEAIEKRIQVLRQEEGSIKGFVISLKRIKKRRKGLQNILSAEESVHLIFNIINEMSEVQNKYQTLETIIRNLTKAGKVENKMQSDINILEKEFHKYITKGEICPLCENQIK